MGGPREAHAGPAHHVDEIGDTQDVLCCLKGRVPSAQDQHGLASKVLRVGGHSLVTLNVLRARKIYHIGNPCPSSNQQTAAKTGIVLVNAEILRNGLHLLIPSSSHCGRWLQCDPHSELDHLHRSWFQKEPLPSFN